VTTTTTPGIRVLRVQHTPRTGTIVLDTEPTDKAARKVLKADSRKLRWSKRIGASGAWYFPRSRDHKAHVPQIQALVDDLVSAGYGVNVVIDDDQTRTPAEIEQDRAERYAAQARRYAERAAALVAESAQHTDATSIEPDPDPQPEPEPEKEPEPEQEEIHEPEPERPETTGVLPGYPILSEPPRARRLRLGVLARKRNNLEKSVRHAGEELARIPEDHKDVQMWGNHITQTTKELAEIDAESRAINRSGIRFYGPKDIKVGGLVFKDRHWHEVVKVNPKSVVVPIALFNTGGVVPTRGENEARERWTWDRVEDYRSPNNPETQTLLRKGRKP